MPQLLDLLGCAPFCLQEVLTFQTEMLHGLYGPRALKRTCRICIQAERLNETKILSCSIVRLFWIREQSGSHRDIDLDHEVHLSPRGEKSVWSETPEKEQALSSSGQSCAEVNFEILARPHQCDNYLRHLCV